MIENQIHLSPDEQHMVTTFHYGSEPKNVATASASASAWFIRKQNQESDPNGKSPKTPGAKLDAGKNRMGLVLGSFARALRSVSEVGTYGANKYSDNGWIDVPKGIERYTDALYRHMTAEAMGEECDVDTELLHAAHSAWNCLARLDLMIREKEAKARKPMRFVSAPPDIPTAEEDEAFRAMFLDAKAQ